MEFTPLKSSMHEAAIQLYTQVFSDAEGNEEGELIGGLVRDLLTSTPTEDLSGYCAIEDDNMIACIIFSRLRFETPVLAFILSPVAVDTARQKTGVGQALINFGIDALKQQGVELLFTYGDPRYYAKTGFRQITEAVIRAPVTLTRPEGWLCQSLQGGDIKAVAGKTRCVDALAKPVYW